MADLVRVRVREASAGELELPPSSSLDAFAGHAGPAPSLLAEALPKGMTEAALRAMPVGVLVETSQGTSWMNAELARIWRWEGSAAPDPAAFRRDLKPMIGVETRGSAMRAAFGASITTGRWRRHTLRRRDGTNVGVRVARRPLPRRNGVRGEATYILEAASPPEPEPRLRQAILAMIGHELRTPISSIVAGADLLQADRLDPGTRDEVTALVAEEANRVNLLIEQLTALTLLESLGGRPESEPVHMLHLARKIGAREARRRPGLHLRLPGLGAGGTIALGDEGFVAQVLTILIDNAAKYAGSTGDVELVVARVADEVAVHLLDRGPGLQGADPAQLFGLFERASAHAGDGRGTGIGLYVARQIVAAMQGRIWAADRPEGGADFGFALPIAR